MSAAEPVICRIRRCARPARWIVAHIGHPNSGTFRAAYCHEHAEESVRLLWNDAPRAYTKTAAGPFDPAALRAALGAAEVREHLYVKQQQIADLEAEQ